MVSGAGCDRQSQSFPSPAASGPAKITVASLSPAATDIVIGMGRADRLVAVSNYDKDREGVRGLPRVGDYQTTDWERLALLRPGVMVTQFAADRLPLGLVQRAADLKIQLVNLPITRLDDIVAGMVSLGNALGEPQLGTSAAEQLRRRLAAVAKQASGPKVRAMIVIDDAGKGIAGQENYLNDALEIAGGQNVIRPGRANSPWPSIDRELLVDLDPEVIFQLLPDASPQVRGSAQRVWQQLPQLRAVRNGRVHLFTDTWCLRPSQHVADLAERFGKALNEARPAGATQPATRIWKMANGKWQMEGGPGRGAASFHWQFALCQLRSPRGMPASHFPFSIFHFPSPARHLHIAETQP